MNIRTHCHYCEEETGLEFEAHGGVPYPMASPKIVDGVVQMVDPIKRCRVGSPYAYLCPSCKLAVLKLEEVCKGREGGDTP